MKILYPDLVWGAIASSGKHPRVPSNEGTQQCLFKAVTHAALENWEYMDVIRKAADPKCSNHIVNSIETIDYILSNAPEFVKRRLKALFGLAGLEHDTDFAAVLEASTLRHLHYPFIVTKNLLPQRVPLAGGKLNVGTRNLAARCLTISAIA
jgi:hypothetical protein